MATRTRGKGTINSRLQGSEGELDNAYPLSRTDGQRVKEWSNNRVILWNDVLSYLRE